MRPHAAAQQRDCNGCWTGVEPSFFLTLAPEGLI